MPGSLKQKILKGLENRLDPLLFEECVCGLLRSIYPTLVHIHGGQDAGLDGLAAGGPGLVITAGEDWLGNLSENIDSHLSQWGEHAFDRFIFATSRELKPRERRKLHERAREKGVELEQTYDRQNLADLLYEKPLWRKKLLGIPGDPPALSEVPETRRPLLDLGIVGREADLEWLHSTNGDRLLFGEPGSGKTFLLLQLVREGKARFLVSEDWGAVRDAYLEDRPEIVIVDDAHLDPGRLVRLRRVREDIGAEFEILATSWLGEKDQVAEALGGLAGTAMHRLERLFPKEILEVFERAGVEAAPEIMGDLVDQAANKPGLAVTLASLWLRGEWREVLTGQAIRRSLIESLRRVLGGEDPTLLLASFALGGDRGMTLDLVAETTGWSRAHVWDLAVRKIAASGVLAPRGEEVLAVGPRVLRYALLKEVFFSSLPAPFDYRGFLGKAPSTASGVENLVRAAHRGVEVPREELLEWVGNAGTYAAWKVLASLDQAAALWVLKNYPGGVEEVAGESLQHAPEATIDELLKRSETATGLQNSTPNHPMRLLKEWVQEIPRWQELTQETLSRRKTLLRRIQSYLESHGVEAIAQGAFFAAFSPALESTRPSPVDDGVTLHWGLVPDRVIERLHVLWRDNWKQLPLLSAESWPHLANTLLQWIEPREGKGEISEDRIERCRAFARRMLQDLAPSAKGSSGFTSVFLQFARQLDLDLPLVPDRVFEVLFPESERHVKHLLAEQAPERQQIQALANDWRRRDPNEVAAVLRFYEDEAAKIERRWPRLTLTLCRTLAESAERPDQWLEAFLEHKLPADLSTLFLEKTVETRGGDWERQIERCLQLEDYAWSTAELVLRLAEPPERLLSASLEVLTEAVERVEVACLRGEVPVPTLTKILEHPDWKLALAAAAGEWSAGPARDVRRGVRKVWRQAILRARSRDCVDQLSQRDDHWLSEILKADSALALEWLQTRFHDADFPIHIDERGAFVAALDALEDEQIFTLFTDLERIAETQTLIVGQLVEHLVWEPRTYTKLLRSEKLRPFHGKPLEGTPPDETWKQLARLAIEAGYSPAQVAACSFHFTGAYWGIGVEHWAKWETAFAKMEKTAEGPLLEVARHGLRIAREKIEAAKQEQRQYELAGHL